MKYFGMLIVALFTFGLVGCSASQESAPEPTPSNIIDGTNTMVIRMPDGFRNVVFTCYGSTGIYVTSRGAYKTGSNSEYSGTALPSSITVLNNDPHC